MKNINWSFIFKVFAFFVLVMAFYQSWFFLGVMMLMVAIGLLIIAAEIAFVVLIAIIFGLILIFRKKLSAFGWAVLIASVLFLISNASWVILLWFQTKN